MAVTGPSSFVPTLSQFVPHWEAVNAELMASGPLVLGDGTTLSQLNGYRDDLEEFGSTIQARINVLELARASIEQLKLPLLERLSSFNRKVRGFLAKSPYVKVLPDVPPSNAGESGVMKPLDDMENVWEMINAATIPNFTPPLTLLDGYLLATFQADLTALKAAYKEFSAAQTSLDIERARRDAVQERAYDAMRDYRAAVLGTFSPQHPLVVTLPRLTPAPGHTPTAVQATGTWDEGLGQAVISWQDSTDPSVDHYELRYSAPPSYQTDADITIDSTATGVQQFVTTHGLDMPGSVALYRVYVVLTTGNESGSNTVTVTRGSSAIP